MNTLLQLDMESLPGRFIPRAPLSDDAFLALCMSNDSIQFERTREGEIRMHSPTAGFTGRGNSEINRQLGNWWTRHRSGAIFDSSAGFRLADGSILSPDASFVSANKLRHLTKEDLLHFLRICPDFVIELLSKSDDLRETQAKMMRWVENGAELGWLVDPHQRVVIVYSRGNEPAPVTGITLDGTGPVQGFTLDLGEVWSRYEV